MKFADFLRAATIPALLAISFGGCRGSGGVPAECTGDSCDADSSLPADGTWEDDAYDNPPGAIPFEACADEQGPSRPYLVTGIGPFGGHPALSPAGGGGYGLAWSDDRHADPQVYFALISPGGKKITQDIRVSRTSGRSLLPSIVGTGNGFAVVFVDDGLDASGDGFVVYASILDSAGTPTPGSPLRVSGAVAGAHHWGPAIAWNGTNLAVAWSDDRECLDFTCDAIRLAVLDAGGSKLAGDVEVSRPLTASPELPSVAWTGMGWVVAWTDRTGVYARLFGPDGQPWWEPSKVSDLNKAYPSAPSVVPSAQGIGVFWWDNTLRMELGDTVLMYALLDQGGRVQHIGPIRTFTHDAGWFRVVGAGAGYGIGWVDGRPHDCGVQGCLSSSNVWFTVVDEDGKVVHPETRVTSTADPAAPYFSLAFDDGAGEYGLTWVDLAAGEFRPLFLARFTCLDE